MATVYEVVRSRVSPEHEAEMLELRPRMVAAVKARVPELLSAQLIKLDDGTWMDVVRWSSREAAVRGAAAFEDVPEARAMGGLVDEVVSFHHGVDAEPDGLSG